MSIKKNQQKVKLNGSTNEQSDSCLLTCSNSIKSQQQSTMNSVPPIILENLKNGNIFIDTNSTNG